MGPVSWAVSGSFSDTLLAGRSRFLYQPDEDQIPEELSAAILWAETLAAVLWDNIGFEGAGLDFVMVSSLDAPVLLEGPGCIFASPAVMADLAHHDTWLDELLTGNPAPGTAVVSKSASSMMKAAYGVISFRQGPTCAPIGTTRCFSAQADAHNSSFILKTSRSPGK